MAFDGRILSGVSVLAAVVEGGSFVKAAIEDAAIVASGAISAVRGRLKVDIDPFFLPPVLAGRLGAFCERYPELAIEFISSEHVGDLVSEGVDLAIRFGQPRLSTLVSRKLIEAPILTVASPGYIERYGQPKHPSVNF